MANEGTVRIKLGVGDQLVNTNIPITKTPEQIAEETRIANEEIEKQKILDANKDKTLTSEQIAEQEKLAQLEKDKQNIATELKEGQVVDLDGIELTINKEGNAIDNTGKVIKTAIELKDLLKTNTQPQTQSTDTDYIKEIQTKTNLVVNDDKGQPITYDNTVEGISKYTEDVFTTGKKLGAIEYEKTILSEFPIIKDVITHLKLNGSLEGFNNKVDYRKITLDDKDDNQWLGIYIAAQAKRGIPEEEARATAKYFKEDGKLKEMAQKSLLYLSNVQTQEETNLQNQLKQQEQQEVEDNNKYWSEVQNVVLKEGKFKLGTEEYVIPKVMRITENGKTVTKSPNDFWNYVNIPRRYNIDNEIVEMTEHQFDLYQRDSKRNVNDDVYDALNMFLKNDKSQLIKAQLNTAVTKQVIKLSSKTNTVGTGEQSTGVIKLVLPVAASKK